MQSIRKAIVSVTALCCLNLTGCGGGGSTPSPLESYNSDSTPLDAYQNENTPLDGYQSDSSPLDGYQNENSQLDNYQNDESALDNYNNNSSSSDSGSSSGGEGIIRGQLDFLDCSDLNPHKIYILGSFSATSPNYKAIVDIENPEHYCVSFNKYSTSWVIADNQEIYYLDYRNALTPQMVDHEFGTVSLFKQEYLIKTEGHWYYPQSAPAIDDQTFFGSSSKIFVRYNQEAAANDIYSYDYPGSGSITKVYLNDTEYFDFNDASNLSINGFLGVTPNGGLLLKDINDVFVYMDKDKNITTLQMPKGKLYPYDRTTYYTDSVTVGGNLWIAAEGSDGTHRLSLNLASLTLTDEGIFSETPANFTIRDSKIDSLGALIQVGTVPGTSRDTSIVIKRPLSTNAFSNQTSIIYTDAANDDEEDWIYTAIPFVHPLKIVTGD